MVRRSLAVAWQIGRDRAFRDFLAVGAGEGVGLHGQEVDQAGMLVLEADGDLHHHGVVVELVAQLLGDAVGVGAGAVELVDEGHARHVVPAHLAIHGDGLGLHARDAAQHQDGAVQHAQGALHLDGEVHVPGGVDDVDVGALGLGIVQVIGGLAPLHAGGRGLDGDAALALEIHGVHGRADAVLALHLVDLVDHAGVEEDALGQGGLARIDVGADADIAKVVQGSHGCFSNERVKNPLSESLDDCLSVGLDSRVRKSGLPGIQGPRGIWLSAPIRAHPRLKGAQKVAKRPGNTKVAGPFRPVSNIQAPPQRTQFGPSSA